jgi:predicted nucleic acid-binding protein
MRVVLDTNILVSALLVHTGRPAAIYSAWEDGDFTLLTCKEQVDELRTTLRKPAIAQRINPIRLAASSTNSESLRSILNRCRTSNAPAIPPTIFFSPCPKRAGLITW